MSSFVTEEGTLKLHDGMELYTKTWKTSGHPLAVLVFIHGFSDHCNAYGDFFPALAAKGIEVRSFDQRGWGRSVHSDKEKGLTGPTKTVMDDITAFMKTCLPSSSPLFLMGHSMGGQEVLVYIHDGPADVKKHIRGYLLESPFIAFDKATKPSPFTVIMGRLVGKLLPHRQMVFKIDPKLLSRDVATQKQFADDKLAHDTGTLEGLAGNLDRAFGLNDGKILPPKDAGEDGKARIWLSHGTKDGVCDYTGTERYYGRLSALEDKELKLYDGWFHRLHSEPSPDRETYVHDIFEWISKRIEGAAAPVRSVL